MKSPFPLFAFLLLLPLGSQGQALKSGSWKMGQPGRHVQWAASCTRPTLLVEEDFTDSLFNGYNAGENGKNWVFFASGVAFRRPNNRSTFPMAVTRNPYVGAGGWAGVLWGKRINPNGGHVDGNLEEFQIDKKDDVFITRFRAFSDFAHRNERAGVEVANMEYRTTLCPPPDFCHDLSFEAKQCFYSRPQDDLQLETNIENTTDRSPFGARRAHYNNLTTKSDLDKEYTSLVIWRNDPIRRKCNIEQWGEANYGDFWLDSHMVSKLDPQNRYAIVSEVQVSLFAADTNFTVRRDDLPSKSAHIGILNVHSGFTKRSDFTLDYRTDEADLAVLTQFLGRSDSATIRRGDANNDGRMSAEDACALAAFWSDSTMHPDTAAAEANFFESGTPNAGEFKISLKNIGYLAIKIPAGAQLGTNQNLESAANLFQAGGGNTNRAYFQKEGFSFDSLSFSFSGGNPEEVEFTVNYAGSCQAEGFTFGLDSIFQYTGTGEKIRQIPYRIFGQTFWVPADHGPLDIQVFDLRGRLVWEKNRTETNPEASGLSLPGGLYRIRVKDAQNGTDFGAKTLFHHE